MYYTAVERPVSAQILPNIRRARGCCANHKEMKRDTVCSKYRLKPHMYTTGTEINAWISDMQQYHRRKIKETSQKILGYIVVFRWCFAGVLFISDYIGSTWSVSKYI